MFEWLKQVNVMDNQKIKKQTPVHDGIESYDPFVMNSGLSDTFSNLDDNKPMAHCYQFIDKNSGFSGATEGIPMQKVDQPPQDSSALDSLIQQRNAEVPRGIMRK